MKEQSVVITNANIFDGKSEKLASGMSVLVEDNLIKKVGRGAMHAPNALTIDAKGRTMTPGFIDSHSHLMFQLSVGEGATSDEFYWAYVSTQTAKTYLMDGFTTIREVSGNSFSLKKAIDRGIIDGPRVYPSGPMISQTSGHSDHRTDADKSALIAKEPSTFMKYNMVQIADGRAEVLKAVRENLRRGASQIKIAVGGGTGSYADPLDVVEYTADEIRAAVEAAADWGTYVLAHVYNSHGIRRAIDNGVKSIEHGQLVDEETLEHMRGKGVWLSPQVICYTFIPKGYTENQANKHRQAYAGIDHMFALCKKIGFEKIAFGSDIITDPETMRRINDEFGFRAKWFTPAEILARLPRTLRSCWRCPARAIPIPGSSASSRKAPTRTYCSSTVIRSRTYRS